MDNQPLPDSRSSTLALDQPTEEEKLAQWKETAASWRGPLSIEAYVRRERYLSQQGLSKNGGLTHWVLVDTAAKDRVVLSGCETLRKKALIAIDGKVDEVISHGIGSVFCPPRLRRRGYGARMMEELGKSLRTWQTDGHQCLYTVLYSDIGKQFYNTHGWKPFPSSHISLPSKGFPHNSDHNVNGSSSFPRAYPLSVDDLPELCAADVKLLRQAIKDRSKTGKTVVALVPDPETFEWHHGRDNFVGNELHGKAPPVKGAIVGMQEGKRAWCVWTRRYKNPDPQKSEGNTLIILRLVVEDLQYINDDAMANGHSGHAEGPLSQVQAIASLLAAAQHEAFEWKMEDVELWNPSPTTVKAAQLIHPSAKVIERDTESITSLMWYGPAERENGIEWVGNEKYGWC